VNADEEDFAFHINSLRNSPSPERIGTRRLRPLLQ
jgi:hypothetical protein